MRDVLLVVAGGLFGVVLSRLLASAPEWVFWLMVAVFILVAILLLSTGSLPPNAAVVRPASTLLA